MRLSDGDLSVPVPCSTPHDAEMIAIVGSETQCPDSYEWWVELEAAVACLVETRSFSPDVGPTRRLVARRCREVGAVGGAVEVVPPVANAIGP